MLVFGCFVVVFVVVFVFFCMIWSNIIIFSPPEHRKHHLNLKWGDLIFWFRPISCTHFATPQHIWKSNNVYTFPPPPQHPAKEFFSEGINLKKDRFLTVGDLYLNPVANQSGPLSTLASILRLRLNSARLWFLVWVKNTKPPLCQFEQEVLKIKCLLRNSPPSPPSQLKSPPRPLQTSQTWWTG